MGRKELNKQTKEKMYCQNTQGSLIESLVSFGNTCFHFKPFQGLFQLFWGKAPGLNWGKNKAFGVIFGIFLEV